MASSRTLKRRRQRHALKNNPRADREVAFLSSAWITREAAEQLSRSLDIAVRVLRDGPFSVEGARIGSVIRVRKPSTLS